MATKINLPIDHFAIALKSRSQVEWWARILEHGGGTVVSKPALIGEIDAIRWIAAVDLGGVLIALVAPGRTGDSLSRFSERIPRQVHGAIHHIAFRVANIEEGLRIIKPLGFRQLSDPIFDPRMDQVFACDSENRIVELIRRGPNFRGTFIDQGVAHLARSERGNHD